MKTLLSAVVVSIAVAVWPVLAQDKPGGGAAGSQPASPPPAHERGEIVARVNDKEIKRKELDAAVQALQLRFARVGRRLEGAQLAEIERGLIDDMISRELILQSANTNQITNLNGKVQEQIDEVTAQLGGTEGLANALREAGIGEQEYRSRVRENVIVRVTMSRVINGAAPVSPEDIRNYYENHREEFIEPESVRASHILIRVPADASPEVKAEKRARIDAIRARIDKGEPFTDVARSSSEDPGSAQQGGDLGYFPRGSMVGEFEAAAFGLQTNQLSEVVVTQFGYHLLLVADHKPAQQRSLDQVQEAIHEVLTARRQAESARKHIDKLRAAAKVEVLWKPAATAPAPETPPVAAPSP
jgi:peptidyl-prolyl cis-trans isomerase C